jgi:hypothetical protein
VLSPQKAKQPPLPGIQGEQIRFVHVLPSPYIGQHGVQYAPKEQGVDEPPFADGETEAQRAGDEVCSGLWKQWMALEACCLPGCRVCQRFRPSS